MTEGTSLDSILSDEPTVVEATPETVEAQGQPRAEDGRFAAKETGVQAEPQGEDTVPPTDQLPPETFKAVKEEREKRQSLERELEALRNQILQTQAQNPPEPPPSVWEDEQGYGNNLVNTAVAQAEFRAGVKMSEMLMRQAEPDFENLKALYLKLEQENPSLIPQVMNDPHPWNKAIQIAKNHKAMEDLGATSVEDMREKLRAELLAEMQTGQTPLASKPLPASLSGERSVASRGGPAWTGPTSLDSLLR